jgi:ABC-type nitrate/sulfonate/bicarbonate transport system substrate-binding protein
MRIAAVLGLAAFALAGCNANQGVNASSQRTLADTYPNYPPYNPIQYAQTSGFYGGR